MTTLSKQLSDKTEFQADETTQSRPAAARGASWFIPLTPNASQLSFGNVSTSRLD